VYRHVTRKASPCSENAHVTFKDPRYEDYTTKVTGAAEENNKIKYSLKPVPSLRAFGDRRVRAAIRRRLLCRGQIFARN
jgi:hypothetical protein